MFILIFSYLVDLYGHHLYGICVLCSHARSFSLVSEIQESNGKEDFFFFFFFVFVVVVVVTFCCGVFFLAHV